MIVAVMVLLGIGVAMVSVDLSLCFAAINMISANVSHRYLPIMIRHQFLLQFLYGIAPKRLFVSEFTNHLAVQSRLAQTTPRHFVSNSPTILHLQNKTELQTAIDGLEFAAANQGDIA